MPLYFDPKFLAPEGYLFKTVRFAGVDQDFWNTFLAGVVQSSNDSTHPLAHLHLRHAPRSQTVRHTSGMMPERTDSGAIVGYKIATRYFKENDNAHERTERPVVHQQPMYSVEEKSGFSKPQATTFVNLRHNIAPSLFGFGNQNQIDQRILSGAFFPFIPRYCLLNRILKYDRGTRFRPYDNLSCSKLNFFSKKPLQYDQLITFNALLHEKKLKGTDSKYTEILARLKMYDAFHDPSFVKPGLFIVYDLRQDIFIKTVLLTLKRAFDLKFCLLRKHQVNYPVPIIVYDYENAPNANGLIDRRILGPFPFLGVENLTDILELIVHGWKEQMMSNELNAMLNELKVQQGLWLWKIGDRFNLAPDWNTYLLTNPPDNLRAFHFFYTETLRAFLDYFSSNDDVSSILAPRFKKLLTRFTQIDPSDKEDKFIQYILLSDYSRVSDSINDKINPRFPFQIPSMPALSEAILKIDNHVYFSNPRFINNHIDLLFQIYHTSVNTHDFVTGKTPLHFAFRAVAEINIEETRVIVMNRILDHPRININARDHKNITPLLCAVFLGFHISIIKRLLEKGADINAQTNDGDTALHYFIYMTDSNGYFVSTETKCNEYFQTFVFFLNYTTDQGRTAEINPCIKNKFEQTPLDIALINLKHFSERYEFLMRKYHHRRFDVLTDAEMLEWNEKNKLINKFDLLTGYVVELLKHPKCLLSVDEIDYYFETGFYFFIDKIKLELLKYKIKDHHTLNSFQEKFLKSLPIENCYRCAKRTRMGQRHHCRRCLEGFCHTCVAKTGGTWYCQNCIKENTQAQSFSI